jgi:hypothetical protein
MTPKNVNQNVYSPMASIAFRSSYIFGIIALAILFFYSIGESCNLSKFLSLFGIVIAIAFASFAVGGIIGFLFGIPHTITNHSENIPPSGNNVSPVSTQSSPVQGSTGTMAVASQNITGQSKSNYALSTNLEQIADWLTKIIVGVGLTQIHKIFLLFNQSCSALGTTLQHCTSTQQNGSLIVGCIIILFTIEGFLIVYLWTFLYLLKIQDSIACDIINTISSKIEDTDLHDKQAIDLANKQLSSTDGAPDIPVNDLAQVFQNASQNILSSIFFKAVLIRKQFWQDTNAKNKIEKTIPVFEALIAVDNNFEFPENYAQLAFVLKDKTNPDYKLAINYLNKAISGFKAGDGIRNKAIIFFNRAYCQIKLDANFIGTPQTSSSPENKQSILNDLNEAYKEPYVKVIIDNDQVVTDWKKLNS